MIEFNLVRDVKSPERDIEDGNNGIDIFVPNYSKEYEDDVTMLNKIKVNGIEKETGGKANSESIVVPPHKAVLIPSGLHTKFSKDICLMAVNKSGVAIKHQLITGARDIDSSYQGEILIHLINTGDEEVIINYGQKLVQMVPIRVDIDDIKVSRNVPLEDFYQKTSKRGANGFGSTGDK